MGRSTEDHSVAIVSEFVINGEKQLILRKFRQNSPRRWFSPDRGSLPSWRTTIWTVWEWFLRLVVCILCSRLGRIRRREKLYIAQAKTALELHLSYVTHWIMHALINSILSQSQFLLPSNSPGSRSGPSTDRSSWRWDSQRCRLTTMSRAASGTLMHSSR